MSDYGHHTAAVELANWATKIAAAEAALKAEREKVRVLREGMRLIQYHTLLSPIVQGIGGTVGICGRISSEALATTAPEGGEV